MKQILFLTLLLMGNGSFAWQEVQNGGGGVLTNGNYMTFYSAHIPVVTTPLSPSEIPGMAFLVNKIMHMPLAPRDQKELLQLIFPTDGRVYFKMDESKMSSEDMKEIVKQYSQLTSIPESSVVVFAVTNRSVAGTVFFPAFYKLQKESERAAMLLHESAWLSTSFDYRDMVQFEMVVQAYFESGDNDLANFREFYRLLGQVIRPGYTANLLLMFASIKHDVDVGLLQSHGLPKGQVYFKDLFGQKFIDCLKDKQESETACEEKLAVDMLLDSSQNPKHLFANVFADELMNTGGFCFLKPDLLEDIVGQNALDKTYVDFNDHSNEDKLWFRVYTKDVKEALGYIQFN